MSIVAYYARLAPDQLGACTVQPDKLASGALDDLPGAEVIDIDRSWDPMAWLLSPLKRVEHEHNNLVMTEMRSRPPPPKTSLGERLLNRFRAPPPAPRPEPSDAIKASLRRVDETQQDLPLVAIEGRTTTRIEQIDFGMGGTAVFHPQQVVELSTALGAITIADIERNYDPERMDREGVFPDNWVEEGRDLFDSYIVLNLRKLQAFYKAAADSGQLVLMWYI